MLHAVGQSVADQRHTIAGLRDKSWFFSDGAVSPKDQAKRHDGGNSKWMAVWVHEIRRPELNGADQVAIENSAAAGETELKP